MADTRPIPASPNPSTDTAGDTHAVPVAVSAVASVPTHPEMSGEIQGHVREVVGELPTENATQKSFGGRAHVVTKTPQERREDLLARLPEEQERAERIMKRQLTRALEDGLDNLTKDLYKTKDFYTENQIMAKIRQFRDMLSELAHIAFDRLKALWLEFVHGLAV